MRDLKFRAWDLETKIMWCHEELAAADCDGVMSLNSIIGGQSHGLIAMQFTGLRDKNGKEIYEGDILQDDEGLALARWHDSGMWGYFLVEETGADYCDGILSDYTSDAAVIGNIHENPELLEAP